MKDIREGGRDDAAKAVVGERPGRVLAGRSAAKVLACNQNLRVLVLRLVQHEIRMRRAGLRTLLNPSPIEEQKVFIAGAFDPLEELLGDNLIGVNVGAVKWSDHTFMLPEWLHRATSTS